MYQTNQFIKNYVRTETINAMWTTKKSCTSKVRIIKYEISIILQSTSFNPVLDQFELYNLIHFGMISNYIIQTSSECERWLAQQD